MQSTAQSLKHYELTEKIIGLFYEVYNELGHGFLESVYEQFPAISLTDAGLTVERQVPVVVWFRGNRSAIFGPTYSSRTRCCLNSKRHAPSTRHTKSSC